MSGGYAFAEIEPKWQRQWDAAGAFRAHNPGEPGSERPKFYCLDMFPYPSADGLHVGHPEGYTATDIICRYRRMRGHNVLHPMGWDAFGLPAEQFAIRTGVHPAVTTRRSIDNFRRQLQRFGFSYDWSREFGTIDEDYYRWTQWLFLRIYDAWYDARSNRARPIAELLAELERGALPPRVNPDAAEHGGIRAGPRRAAPTPANWSAATPAERRTIVDSYRLAYLAEVTVNWCPKLGTALANEEIIDGKSERGGYPVFRKSLRQWMFRITAYAGRLLDDLKLVHWPESTRTQQTEWIGRSEGAEIDFAVVDGTAGAKTGAANTIHSLRIFTTRPDTIFGATYMVVAPEHPLVSALLEGGRATAELAAYVAAARNRSDVERQESREKTGVFTGLMCRNPATGRDIPVWTADYVLIGYGTGAIMAVPGQDQRDWDFAKTFDLPIVRTVQPPADFDGEAYLEDGPAINSGFLDGLPVDAAKQKAIEWIEAEGIGRRRINYKLRDWVFSRQRYWGEPFPIVYDAAGDHYPVDESALPVKLPDLVDYAPVESADPQPLLAKAQDWVSTTAGVAGATALPPDAPVRRETNTMPGWAGSCWYYLRFADSRNKQRFVDRAAERYWLNDGVDLYVGGSEHAVLHLLYARFWHKILHDLGEVSSVEPFRRLFHQGLITSFAYQRADRSLVPVDQVEDRGEGAFVETATGQPVQQVVAKMSKSLKNVVNPDDIIAQYGADTFRLYEMYMGPLEASKPWNTRDIIGVHRFLHRVWRLILVDEHGTGSDDRESPAVGSSPTPAAAPRLNPKLVPARNDALERLLHKMIKKVQADIESFAFNTAIAQMIVWVNEAGKADAVGRDQVERFLLVLAPFAPHIAEELWERLGCDGLIAQAAWPTFDESLTQDAQVEMAVQVNGKKRGLILVSASAAEADVVAAACALEPVARELAGRKPTRVVVVKGRLVNLSV